MKTYSFCPGTGIFTSFRCFYSYLFSLTELKILTQVLTKLTVLIQRSLPNHLPDSRNTTISLQRYCRLNFEKRSNFMISLNCHKWALWLIEEISLCSQSWWYFWHMEPTFIGLLFWAKETESEAYSGHNLGFNDTDNYLLTSQDFRHKSRCGGGQDETLSQVWIQFSIHFRQQLIKNFIYNSRLGSPFN